MRVTMKAAITGTRDGRPWPNPGTTVDLPDAEARDLLRSGLAVETATREGRPERAAKPNPRRR